MGLGCGSRLGRWVVVVALVAALLIGLTHVADHDHGGATGCAACVSLVHLVQPEIPAIFSVSHEPCFVGVVLGRTRTPSREFACARRARAPPVPPSTW